MPGHTIKTAEGVDILKAVFNGGNLTEIYLRTISGGQQYDALEVLPIVGLTPGLHADVTINAFDRTGGQIQ